MQTLSGVRFLSLGQVGETMLGLEAAWLSYRTLLLIAALIIVTPSGFLSTEPTLAAAERLCFSLLVVGAVALTSVGHELGHAVAGRLTGLRVRAIVIFPHGGVTIRAASQHAHVNFLMALAGPLANALLGSVCLALVARGLIDGLASRWFVLFAVLQLLTAIVNLVPVGRLDGAAVLAAWREVRKPGVMPTGEAVACPEREH
jgi:Zn-dependent protease